MKRNWLSVRFSQPNRGERRRTRWIWVAVEESTAESRAGTSCILSTPFRLATCLLDPHSCSCPSLTKSPIRLPANYTTVQNQRTKLWSFFFPKESSRVATNQLTSGEILFYLGVCKRGANPGWFNCAHCCLSKGSPVIINAIKPTCQFVHYSQSIGK